MKAAFANWPHRHRFQPDDQEHLRKWLLVEAGHCDVTTVYVGDYATTDAMDIVLTAFKAAKERVFPDIRGNVITLRVARSIAFDKLPHKEACRLFDEIGAVITDAIGVPSDALLREGERVA